MFVELGLRVFVIADLNCYRSLQKEIRQLTAKVAPLEEVQRSFSASTFLSFLTRCPQACAVLERMVALAELERARAVDQQAVAEQALQSLLQMMEQQMG